MFTRGAEQLVEGAPVSARANNRVTPEQAAEYRELVPRIGKMFKAPGPQKQPAYKGIRQVAEALGIGRTTLEQRMSGKSNITTEQLLALRYLYENPQTLGFGSAVERLPEPPRVPMTMREKIAGVLRDLYPQEITPKDIQTTLSEGNWRTATTARTVQQRLYEMSEEELPLVVRAGRGLWRASEHNWNENI